MRLWVGPWLLSECQKCILYACFSVASPEGHLWLAARIWVRSSTRWRLYLVDAAKENLVYDSA
jgi:hypothetical protein